MLILDTSAVLAAVDRRDREHERVLMVMREDRGPRVLPVGVLAETTYMVDVRVGPHAVLSILRDLDDRTLMPDCGVDDLARIVALVKKYADLPLGYADAAVIACAERRNAPVLSLDDRDFTVVAGEGTFRLAELP